MLATFAPSPRIAFTQTKLIARTVRPNHPVERLNPLEQRHWDSQFAAQEDFSFFHGAAWAKVLAETYGHAPNYFTHDGELLPVMEISSPLTGKRGVALPFTDDCEPLCENAESFKKLFDAAIAFGKARGWKFLEIRGGRKFLAEAAPSLSFYGHTLDLSSGEKNVFERFESSTRRAIRKAEKEGVTVEITHRLDSLFSFYRLQCLTRKRHGLPPQPFTFFDNIHKYVLSRNAGFIALAKFKNTPIAAAVFFYSDGRAIFKFGASDESFQHLRGSNLAMWEGIKALAQHHRVKKLSFGKTSLANDGLRKFKLGWGADEQRLEYFKFDLRRGKFVTDTDKCFGWHNRIFQSLPVPASRLIGKVLYRHMG
ncbi:MAG TPA: peptidoglycan bridge formation glycyltransferase FemA/FemB family protein [Verrucomicrobiae bacterium]|nr:peptidoglycan bridge formation glycyltransferase FemA/FemB family protein [Verrucomicrobiae bacterium]